jgi:tetratricopeptide (TPR) repeat protein
MARSGAKRKTQRTADPGSTRKLSKSKRAAPRHEYSHVEDAMFFPKLRRQAKWVFVFLALTFAIGFVAFGVGGGGNGIGDIFQGLSRGSSSGPSVGDAQKKIKKGDLAAYKELAEAYRVAGKQDEAIAAGEQYIQAKPKDYDFMRSLASDYEGKATKQREEALVIQEDLNARTGGTTFGLDPKTVLGRALGTGRIDQELTTAANQKLTELYSGIQSAYTHASELYQKVSVVKPDDVLLQLLLAQSAYQSRNVPTAIAAYKRVIKLAPDSAEAQQAKQQIQLLKLQASAGAVPSG